MHEVEIHVEEVGLIVAAVDDVAFPYLLGQRLRHGAILPGAAAFAPVDGSSTTVAGRSPAESRSVLAVAPGDLIDVVIEIPRGSRNKYEYDHERHIIRLDRRLFSATVYPTDYGFVPDTLAEDGDPLDVLVLLEDPTAYADVHDLPDLPQRLLDEIEHFFDVYKMLEPDKQTTTRGYEGRDAAWTEIAAAQRRYTER